MAGASTPLGGRKGIYTLDSRPTCVGLAPMEYVGSDPQRGHLFRCPPEGCHLRDRKGVRYCHDEKWLNRKDNPRLFGQIPRWSREWKALYRLRQSVERVFKSMKESRRLKGHYIRGFRKISLLAANVDAGVHRYRATPDSGLGPWRTPAGWCGA